jgi:hypothetical protein
VGPGDDFEIVSIVLVFQVVFEILLSNMASSSKPFRYSGLETIGQAVVVSCKG